MRIFDCFFAGCIPIYWGADNVNAHIPEGCFIDKREFDSYEEYIKNMSDKDYIEVYFVNRNIKIIYFSITNNIFEDIK